MAEASQLLEARTESRYDRVLVVIAPEAERVSRWEKKGGDAEDARRRIASQIAPPLAVDRASDVIVNDGTLDELESKVEAGVEGVDGRSCQLSAFQHDSVGSPHSRTVTAGEVTNPSTEHVISGPQHHARPRTSGRPPHARSFR